MPRGIKKLLQSEPAVIERWVKIRSVRTGRRIGRRMARPRTWLKERRRVRDLELAFATVREQIAIIGIPHKSMDVGAILG